MKNLKLFVVLSIALLTRLVSAKSYESWPVPVGPLCEMTYTPQATHFSLWSPKAEAVRVHLYAEGQGGMPLKTYDIPVMASDGTWGLTVEQELHGYFYTFQIKADGKWLPETPGIFARAVGVNGMRAQVLDMKKTNPHGWMRDRRPELRRTADVVIYEMHHRDFSVDAESGSTYRGKFLSLSETGTTNAAGQKTGIDHLVELGVNHVHLLPSYDYGSVDETRLNEPQYNWGYDPVNYNVPDGSYSTNPYDPAVRISEFKEMVMALHKAGIRVVLDVVYNHVFDLQNSNFQRTAPNYFFRYKADGTPANGSGCGNETASERPMMRKFMVESVLYWIREYHIDGFRFDLMGVHDIETMNAIRRAVDAIDPSIILYGEGWAAESPSFPEEKLAMKKNMHQLPGIAAFGDEMRDGLRGPWSGNQEGAFVVGCAGHEESVKFGIVGACWHPQVDIQQVNYTKEWWATEPTQLIGYVSCHDDMCLADRIKVTAPEADVAERVRLQKLAETVVLTSQGIPFIWCGDEMMRDKKGVHNSYNSPDSINVISWKLKTENQSLFLYLQTLIAMRKAHPAFRMGRADLVRKHLQFLPVKGKNLIAYRLADHAAGDEWRDIIVVLNSNTKAVRQEVPEGEWTIIAKDGAASLNGLGKIKGKTVKVPAQSALILKR